MVAPPFQGPGLQTPGLHPADLYPPGPHRCRDSMDTAVGGLCGRRTLE